MTEQEILQRYSTPGLRRNVFTRAGKKAHLQSMRWTVRTDVGVRSIPRFTPDEIEQILNELYPPTDNDEFVCGRLFWL